MRLLLVSQVFPPRHGGSGRWLWELFRDFSDISVTVAAGDAPGAAEFDRSAPITISRVPLDFSSWGVLGVRPSSQYVRALATMNRMAKKHQADAIHAGKALPEGLLALAVARWRRIPFVLFAHGEELTLAETSRELAMLTGAVVRRASMIVANSRHTRAILVERWRVPDRRIVVMHPGVDTGRFVPGRDDRERRAEWRQRRVILTVGTLQLRKGQDMMIRALPAIRAQCPDVLYAMAGGGPDRPRLEALVAELGVEDAVQFLGPPSDETLVSLYQQCDLFALPNRRIGWDLEGFGIVALEAQSCGKAVIVGASGGAPETIDPGVTGEAVACEEPEPLARAVITLLNDPVRRTQMGLRGRERAVAFFDWEILRRQASQRFQAGDVARTSR